MEDKDILNEIPVEDIPLLLKDLESDLPNSVHTLAFLDSINNWKKYDPDLIVKILAPHGDFRTKIIVYHTTSSDNETVIGGIHKWSHSEEDDDFLDEVLRSTKQIPWKAVRVSLSAIGPETEKAVIPVLNDIWGEPDVSWRRGPPRYLFWVPKEEAKDWKVEVPEGTHLSFLTAAHAKRINDVWPYSFAHSEEIVVAMIQAQFGIGLFNTKTNELMAWALHWYYGCVGLLQTEEDHLKKGYGGLVLKATAKEIAKRGIDVHLVVVKPNLASRSLVQKVGFRFVHLCTWADREFGH